MYKFGELLLGNSRDNGAHLRTSGTTRPKTGVFRWISQDILDRFSQYFHHMKGDASVLHSPICQGTLPWKPNNLAVMKVNWYYVHSLQFARWSTVLFRYYLLGGDTVAPSRLLARLCHAFLVKLKLSVTLRSFGKFSPQIVAVLLLKLYFKSLLLPVQVFN